ncbi:ubiquitin-conjugating enzyme/RWD-like protein [Aspergillus coremiiformis]|uniref:Ubiquitin-conjugating enzyme/RWD-like protein n=1 Tax=Aspergillus coremiiformis TaxID=138285 RepID=A0A5N6Z0P0_9EURO|nr:ubiquitin-conjugating enzyme/RWD-like protein [Aspergillus coremiiformis]
MTQNQPCILPPDIMESQLAMIDLLTAMFPSPGELEIPTSTTQCIEKLQNWCQDPTSPPSGIPSSILLAIRLPVAADQKRIQVNISIPLQSTDPNIDQLPPPPSYSLRQPDWMSKAELAELTAAMPADDIFAAFEYVQAAAESFLEARQTMVSPTVVGCESIVRVWFYFPSLSTREKRDDLVNHAPGFSLTGFVLAGKPGLLCLEGTEGDIDAYMRFIKTHSWGDIPSYQKKVSERFRETEGVERVFSDMQEITDSLGERSGQRANRGDMQALEAWLRDQGLQEAFEKVIF